MAEAPVGAAHSLWSLVADRKRKKERATGNETRVKLSISERRDFQVGRERGKAEGEEATTAATAVAKSSTLINRKKKRTERKKWTRPTTRPSSVKCLENSKINGINGIKR